MFRDIVMFLKTPSTVVFRWCRVLRNVGVGAVLQWTVSGGRGVRGHGAVSPVTSDVKVVGAPVVSRATGAPPVSATSPLHGRATYTRVPVRLAFCLPELFGLT